MHFYITKYSLHISIFFLIRDIMISTLMKREKGADRNWISVLNMMHDLHWAGHFLGSLRQNGRLQENELEQNPISNIVKGRCDMKGYARWETYVYSKPGTFSLPYAIWPPNLSWTLWRWVNFNYTTKSDSWNKIRENIKYLLSTQYILEVTVYLSQRFIFISLLLTIVWLFETYNHFVRYIVKVIKIYLFKYMQFMSFYQLKR